VTLTDRDRKIVLALIPLALVAAYFFLALKPKREEAAKIQDQLTAAQSERDTAVQKAASLATAKRSFASDYATVIYLGKSIPSSVDMPSLLVQLDRAARGTGIKFSSIQAGARTPGTPAASAGTTGAPAPSGPAGSSTPAQSAPGQAAQSAGSAVNQSNSSSAAAGLPAGGSAPASGSSASALDKVPLDFEFHGSFFDLADFFHRMKRFVRVANNHIVVRGRLMTINSFGFDSADQFPSLTATVHATVYLAPKAEGVAAGAASGGSGGSAPAAGTPNGQTASSSSSAPPAASVTTR
jgi:Tfp pilus assembly protein PilO